MNNASNHKLVFYQDSRFAVVLLSVLLLIGFVAHLQSGAISIVWHELFTLNAQQSLVLWELRLPRVLLVAFIGAGLALAGVGLQALFRNPLAEPALIGISSSAALGTVFVIVLGGTLWQSVAVWQMNLAAFLSAGLATIFIYLLATRYGRTDVALMLLAGVALNALAGAATQLLVSISDDAQLRNVTFWLMGSFANVSWLTVALVAVVTSAVAVFFISVAQALNAFMLGENISLHMGYDCKQIKWQIMFVSALMVGVAVASVGVIGFVGLIVPHIIRLWMGSNHRTLLPLSAIAGATLLVFADLVAKTLIAPAELPIGLFMALIGAPFFLMMLLKQRQAWLKS